MKAKLYLAKPRGVKRKNLMNIFLNIKVSCHASSCRIKSNDFPQLEIALNAVPEKGKANEILLKFLSKSFNLPISRFSIFKGQTQKTKVIKIELSNEEHTLFLERIRIL